MTTLRKLEPGDVSALETLFVALRANGDARFFHPHPLDPDGARTVCRYQGKDYYCATIREGVALAYGMLRGWDEGFDVPSLGVAVHPGSRGRGLATAMLEHLHEVARQAGAVKVRLRVHYDNHHAVALYRRMGYEFPTDAPGAGSPGGMLGFKQLAIGGSMHVPWARPVFWGGEKEAVADAIASTQISGGRYLDEFEHRFADLHGVTPRRVLAVNNGTAALQLALLLAGANALDADGLGGAPEVIVPGFGFQAAANMAKMMGATPVFADVLPDTWLIDPDDVARKITPRTKAVVAVHTYGNVCDMGALVRLCQQHPKKITLIEDCAESLFSRYGATSSRPGSLAGTLGDIATFSFQATKTITCGEGGAVIVNGLLSDEGRLWRSHGMHPDDRKYVHRLAGFNMRLTNMQAAMLCVQLRHRDSIIERRRFVWDRYQQRLHGYVRQQLTDTVVPVMWATGVRLNAHVRNEIADELAAKGIETRPGFAAASQQPLYSTPPLPVSEALANEVLTLPMPADLTEREFEFIRDSLDAATAAR